MVLINSSDRTSVSPSSTDFTIEFFHRELRFSRFRVRKVVLPKTLYNINATNNVVSFNDGVALTATLTNGSYSDVDDLATELVAKMITASAAGGSSQTYTYTYSSVTGLVSITSSGTSSITWSANLVLAKILGFTADTASGTSHVSTQRVNLEPYPYFYLCCKQLTDQTITSNQTVEATIQSVNSLSHAFGSVVEEVYDYTPYHTLGSNQTFSKLSFRLVDHNGELVDLQGSEIFIELEVM